MDTAPLAHGKIPAGEGFDDRIQRRKVVNPTAGEITPTLNKTGGVPSIDIDTLRPRNTATSSTSNISEPISRDYARHLDPLNTTGGTHSDAGPEEPSSTISQASTQVEVSPRDYASPLPSSPQFPLRTPKSFRNHRKAAISIDAIPQQTILKALASRPPNSGNPVMSLSGLLSASKGYDSKSGAPYSQRLSAALSELQVSGSQRELTPATARFNPLQSPCFYHQRFDDAVDIEKVLEEIAQDEWMSHSRLMQTATGVREVSKQLQRRPIKQAVRNVMIVTKARDNSLVHLTRELAAWLISTPRYGSRLGVNVYVDSKLRRSKRFDAAGLWAENPKYEQMLKFWTPDLCWTSPEKFDLVLTLGGDGTVLFTSWLFQRIVPPILSFSLGSLGFLTNFEFAQYKHHLNRVLGEQGMRVNLRMRFTCTVYRTKAKPSVKTNTKHNTSFTAGGSGSGRTSGDASDVEEGEQFEVLNELVIDRGPSPYVSNLELYGDDELLTVVQADGCIFSTPTGSTAYSLSAGGSLVHPSLPAILLTPICPHTLSFRPMVLADTLLLRIAVPRSSRATAYCSFDGKGRVELRQGDFVTVEASQYPFPTVVGEGGAGGEWFESLRGALRWNTRGAVQKGWNGGGKKEGGEVGRDGGDEGPEGEEEEEQEWDIDTEPDPDSGIGTSEEEGASSVSASPLRRAMVGL